MAKLFHLSSKSGFVRMYVEVSIGIVDKLIVAISCSLNKLVITKELIYPSSNSFPTNKRGSTPIRAAITPANIIIATAFIIDQTKNLR